MMSNPRLPPELFDHIVDHLYDQPKTLKQCCLVSKSWIPCTRKHLFDEIVFRRRIEIEMWKIAFPNPVNSPGRYARSLFFCSADSILPIIAEESGWIQAFCSVVQLKLEWYEELTILFLFVYSLALESHRMASMSLVLDLQVLTLICFLPHLEDLKLVDFWVVNRDDDNTGFQPTTSPPLTRTLTITHPRRIERLLPGLLDLPNGTCFRKLEISFDAMEDVRLTVTLVEVCSNTLECVDIRSKQYSKSLQF